jgi:hypothetical protein
MPQTPYRAKIYHVRSKLINPIGQERHSREDLFNIARTIIHQDETVYISGVKVELTNDYQSAIDAMAKLHRSYVAEITNYKVGSIQLISQSSYTSSAPVQFTSFDEITRRREEFSQTHRPKELGGKSLAHPILYYESIRTLESKLKKTFTRNQKLHFSVTQSENNQPVSYKLLGSNFIEGARIIPSETDNSVFNPSRRLDLEFPDFIKNYSSYDSTNMCLTLEQAIEQRLAPRLLDITSLVKYRTLLYSALWGGPANGAACLSLLKYSGSDGLDNNRVKGLCKSLYVVTNKIPPNHQTNYEHGKVRIIQHPTFSDSHKSYSRITMSNLGKWEHYDTVWYGKSSIVKDTPRDSYNVLELSNMEYIPVSILDKTGINFVFYDEFPIYCIDKAKQTMTKRVVISQRMPSLVTHNLVRELYYDKKVYVSEIVKLTSLLANVTTHTEDPIIIQTTENVIQETSEIAELNAAMMEEQDLVVDDPDNECFNEQEKQYLDFDQPPIEFYEYPLDSDLESDEESESSADTYDEDQALPEFLDDELSQLSSTYSCANNPTPHIARLEGLIFDDGIELLHGKKEVAVKRRGRNMNIPVKRHIFSVKVPDEITFSQEHLSRLHRDEDPLLELLSIVGEIYESFEDIRYLWFRAHLSECVRRIGGNSTAITQVIRDLQLMELKDEEVEDDYDMNDMSFF